MEYFDKNLLKTEKKKAEIYDDYEKNIGINTERSRQIEAGSMADFASSKENLQFLGRASFLVTVAIAANSIVYPWSIRLVKKTLGVKNFFNIHFAILPILANFNAILLGNLQGYINAFLFRRKYLQNSPRSEKDKNEKMGK